MKFYLYFCSKIGVMNMRFNGLTSMIKRVKIENYKSVADQTLNVGRFNVVIGANVCGKYGFL